ncbi:hypothetical protein [Edwardsiella tarda]|uniref:hypothetical protein n=1 Tax=Edwardsiella tarda TaxID=636 RepID=UPI00030558B9|nr:hypothetical protein [Edwardsiella tarda]
MKLTDIPAKQAVPFGVNGQREALLPTTPAGDNKASYNNGFPPVTMILKSAGGVPPKGQDMNQILFELSSLCRWFSAGGAIKFDSDFCATIGGYPIGAYIMGDDDKTVYRCTQDDNTNNPNSSSTGWVKVASDIASILQLKGAAYLDVGITSGTVASGDDPRFKYGSPLVGQLIEWPMELMPQEIWTDCGMEFIPYMGQQFDKAKFPLLAALHPSGWLPVDMRGYAPRGWDNARGIDPGRALLSGQEDAMQQITGELSTPGGGYNFLGEQITATGPFSVTGSSAGMADAGGNVCPSRLIFDSASVTRTANETRMKNVAWNMIVRAK